MSLIFPALTIKRNHPENYKEGELDFCKDEFSYSTYDIYKLPIKGHIITFQGIAYDSNYKVLSAALVNSPEFRPYSFHKTLKKLYLKKKRSVAKEDKYLFCFDEWTNNHYHWICDFLPRLVVVREDLVDYTLLLPETSYIKNVGVPLLKYFDLLPKRIEFIKSGEIVRVDNLDFVTRTVLSGRINDKLIGLQKDKLIANTDAVPTSPYRRIYISRANAANRKVLNESEVIDLLKEFDFEIIEFENYSIDEQIQLCNQTSILVSIHGAGLTNSIFMQKGSSVLEFRRDKIYHNQCYWHLAASLDIKYYYLFGQPDADTVIEGPNGCNLTIPIPYLKETIEKIINAAVI